jgi:prepilin-type processing-associated H-X9-DG protein/prepilin-type N-terminal cleavage/methylation domain-containing protein
VQSADASAWRFFTDRHCRDVRRREIASRRSAFTLVELLATLTILGLLVGLLVPAIQAARESARRIQCSTNLKNIGLGLLNFEAANRSFPPGSDGLGGTQIAWSSRILPFLDYASLFRQIDFTQPWDAPGANLTAAQQNIELYVCPSGEEIAPGMQDYGGIQGTSLLPLAMGTGPQDAFGCGVMIVTGASQPYPVTIPSITDGTSYTLAIGESVDREQPGAISWACGLNCFSQNQPAINVPDNAGNLFSRHPQGANALFADGHVVLLDETIATQVLGGLCTRNGGETIPGSVISR